MKQEDIKRFRQQINEIRENMSGIREQAASLSAMLDEEKLIPSDIANKLICALKEYQEKTAQLQKTGQEISLSMSDRLSEIEDQLKTAEDKIKNAAEMELIQDYFRLTSEAENARQQLEASKKKLQERLHLNSDVYADEFNPYKLAVLKIRDKNSQLTMEDFSAVHTELGLVTFLLMQNKDSLYIDPTLDISNYLREINIITEPVETSEPIEPKTEKQPGGSVVEETQVSPESEDKGEPAEFAEDSIPKQPEDEPAPPEETDETPVSLKSEEPNSIHWDNFDGYVGEAQISFDNTSVSSLGASKFISAARNKRVIPMAMFALAHVKIIGKDYVRENIFFKDVSPDVMNYLIKQEYLMPVKLLKNSEESSYLMLTSKGWGIYKKLDIVKFLKSLKSGLVVPDFARILPEDYTAKNILKMLLIKKYYDTWEKDKDAFYTIFPETDDQPLHGLWGSPDDEECALIVPMIFEQGSEKQDIEKLAKFINEWDQLSSMYLLCKSENDISTVTEALAPLVDVSMEDQVFLCSNDEVGLLFDLNGEPVEPDDDPDDGIDWNKEADINKEDDDYKETSSEALEPAPVPSEVTATDNTSVVEEFAATPEISLTSAINAHIDECTEEMLGNNKLYCASAYLAAAAKTYPQIQPKYNCLAFALNDTISKPRYSSQSVIQTFFSESAAVPEAWVIAAVLRNFFLDHVQYDYDIQSLYDTVKQSGLYSASPMLKIVLRSLMDFKRKNGHGLDYYADYRTVGAASYEANLRDIQKEAKTLYETFVEGATRENAKNERFIETKKLIFARDGELAAMLQLVVGLQQKEANFIKEYLRESFLKDGADFDISNIDTEKMDKIVDRAWTEAQDKLFFKRSNIKFVGELRRNLISKIRECVDLLCRFVEICDASAIDESDTGAIDYKRIRKELLSHIDSALSELKIYKDMDKAEKADRNVLCFALREIQKKIDGTYQEEERKFFYLPFLRSEHVLLNESFLPELRDVEGLPEMSAMSCIERHARSTLKTIPEYIEEILHGEDDYGSLDLLMKYLNNQEPEDPDELQNLAARALAGQRYAHDSFEERQKDFAEYLELAQSYGQINSTVEDKKETMLQTAKVWFEYAEETSNYGFYSKVIEAFKEKICEDAKTRAIDLEKNLDAYKKANPKWANDSAAENAVQKIEERIKFQNYSAAEDMLNRLQSHDLDEQIPYITKDYLAEFLEEYNDIARLARATGAFNITLSERTREGKAGTILLQHWPKSLGTSEERIRELLLDLGFSDPKVTAQTRLDRMDCFNVVLKKPVNGRKSNYTHPISIFGSEAQDNGFRVVCTFGRRQPEELIDSFKAIGNAKNTIMFLDYALTLPERRKLARLAKKEFNGKTFAVVDRVVAAYLAKHYSVTAMNRMLMSIVIPFAYYQPYVAESSRVMPPEIFMGRKNELEKIEAADGVNIVYGGRQLGKTALLRMAQKDINWNENGDRAVLIDIKGLNYKETAKKIAAELVDQYVLDVELPSYKAEDWKELGRAIKKVLREGNEKGEIPYLLLLLDEADTFIESCAEVNYQPFDVLKDIQSVGSGRFKFVVAGLRNVVRFNRDAALSNNSVLTHLSSLTVTPFRASDARELLQTPLHYLGFRFQDDNKTDMLISNIFGTTNYFPGLLQLYCAKLIEAMRRDYAGYDEIDTPPYMIREEHIKKVLADKTLEDQIREKFEITLKVDDDDYYYQIAVLMAFHYHNVKPQNGCSPKSLLNIAKEYGLPKISALTVEEVRALMEELRELNVLQMVGNGNYRFTRLSFCEMMGLPNEIDDKIMALATEA